MHKLLQHIKCNILFKFWEESPILGKTENLECQRVIHKPEKLIRLIARFLDCKLDRQFSTNGFVKIVALVGFILNGEITIDYDFMLEANSQFRNIKMN